jgi:TolB protein
VANFLPYWSPDGTQIMYQRSWTGPNEVWIMNADGSDPRKVTTSLPGSWSPDGTSVLVFDRGVGGELWDVFKVNVETGERENLTQHEALDNWPVWRW